MEAPFPRQTAFRFDVVEHRIAPGVSHKRFCACDHIAQQRLGRGFRHLLGKRRMLPLSAVIRSNLFIRHAIQIVLLRLVLRDGRAIGRGADLRVHPRLVGYDNLAVGADDDIHFQRGHALLQRILKRRPRILGAASARPTMALHIEPSRRTDCIGTLGNRTCVGHSSRGFGHVQGRSAQHSQQDNEQRTSNPTHISACCGSMMHASTMVRTPPACMKNP